MRHLLDAARQVRYLPFAPLCPTPNYSKALRNLASARRGSPRHLRAGAVARAPTKDGRKQNEFFMANAYGEKARPCRLNAARGNLTRRVAA